jgi:RecJ-like exonuclease
MPAKKWRIDMALIRIRGKMHDFSYRTGRITEQDQLIADYPCPNCGGDGKIVTPRWREWDGYDESERRCDDCSGLGYIDDENERAVIDEKREQEKREAADWCCECCGEYGDGDAPEKCPACDEGTIDARK